MNIPRVEDINYNSYADVRVAFEGNGIVTEVKHFPCGEYCSYSITIEDLLKEEANTILLSLSKMELPKVFERGDQIAYINDIEHKDVEFGFVTSVSKHFDVAFCRFWSRSNPDELRTKANSEGCSFRNLTLHNTKPRDVILEQLKEIDEVDLFGGLKA